MGKKLIALIIAFFAASVLVLCMTHPAKSATNREFIKDYLAPKHVVYSHGHYTFEFDIDINFTQDGKATPVIKNLKKRNPQAWGSLAVTAQVETVSKGSDMVRVMVKAEAKGYGRWFSQAYGQPLKWGDLSKDETRIEFKEEVFLPFDKYPELARIERFEPGGAAQLSAPEEPASSKREQAQGSEWLAKINVVEGMVRIRKANGEWLDAMPGMELETGDYVKTGSDGKAVLNLEDAIIKVRPDSEFVIPEEKTGEEKATFIRMIKGMLWCHAKKDENSLKVATPNAVCGVRGTEFEVSYKDSITCVEVFEGTVWLSSSEDAPKTAVNAGQKSCIPAGDGQRIGSSSTVNNQLSGKWKTDFGMVTFTHAGNDVMGSYTHNNGKIEGTLEGNILRGRWSEAPSYKTPKDAGDLEFTFSDDGRNFTGTWRYGSQKQSWDGKWTGEKQK